MGPLCMAILNKLSGDSRSPATVSRLLESMEIPCGKDSSSVFFSWASGEGHTAAVSVLFTLPSCSLLEFIGIGSIYWEPRRL